MDEKEMRELDAWIHCHVMGVGDTPPVIREPDLSFFPHYTTDQSAAMRVLEVCASKVDILIEKHGALEDGDLRCYVFNADDETSRAKSSPTLPIAICLFAKQLYSK